ncbi:hypothetical protein DY000_02058507 [Brassica cretica]|uniref:Uncharacterized protein n=1 Tax=Brassica cretica TaxID=69181 RepID=A0ABQ7AP08_BRACR|nr:hypothetical protein DY000_02058507 [Brassica cretica]
MSSKKETSRKATPRSSKSKSVRSDDNKVIPKDEFVPHSVDPEETEAYWAATCNMITPPSEAPFPARPSLRTAPGLPSRSSDSHLDAIQNFCRIPSEVEFWVPLHGESADSPPEGYFTCYEAFVVCCRLLFPIPKVIFHALNRFGISINQLNLTGLHHLIGILVLSYEYGLILLPTTSRPS